jgi:hypothetical protein
MRCCRQTKQKVARRRRHTTLEMINCRPHPHTHANHLKKQTKRSIYTKLIWLICSLCAAIDRFSCKYFDQVEENIHIPWENNADSTILFAGIHKSNYNEQKSYKFTNFFILHPRGKKG